jgi:hypothetical protein
MLSTDQLTALQQTFPRHHITLAYLFGSRAEGRARPSSDTDIAVLLPYEHFKALTLDSRVNLINDIFDALGTENADVVILNEAPPLLAFEVIKHGKIIYEDPETRPAAEFAVYALNQYLDTKPLRAMRHKYLRERISTWKQVAEQQKHDYQC